MFFNATARTLGGYVGLIFRKAPYLRLPEGNSALGKAMAEFSDDCDMLGTSLYGYAKEVVREVVSVGRCGTPVDWQGPSRMGQQEVGAGQGAFGTGPGEERAYAALYRAEQILNWRVGRVNGRNIATLVVLHEPEGGDRDEAELYDAKAGEQIRVLRLDGIDGQGSALRCVVDMWRPKTGQKGGKVEWELVETRVPMRRGRPLPLIQRLG